MPEGCPAFVHDLCLFLRIKILTDFTHDAQNLTLPGFQQRGIFFHKVEQVFLWFRRVAASFHNGFLFFTFWQSAPQRVDLALQVLLTAFLAGFLFLQGDFLRTFITINAIIHQRVAGIEQFFHLFDTVSLFTIGDVVTGENQVVDNRTGIRPAAEQIIILKERVMPVAGMRHNQRLHGDGVLFHQIGDTGIGVNDNLVGQTLLSMLIKPLGFNKFFTE